MTRYLSFSGLKKLYGRKYSIEVLGLGLKAAPGTQAFRRDRTIIADKQLNKYFHLDISS